MNDNGKGDQVYKAITDLAHDIGKVTAQLDDRVTYKELMSSTTDMRREIIAKIERTASDITRQIEANLRERDAKSVGSMLHDIDALRRDFKSMLEHETARAAERSKDERDREQAELRRLLDESRAEMRDSIRKSDPRVLGLPVWAIQLLLVMVVLLISLLTRDPGLLTAIR